MSDAPDPRKDPIYLEEMKALSQEWEAGKLVPRDYNARRRAALEGARARASKAAGSEPATAEAETSAPAPAPDPGSKKEEDSGPALPDAWAKKDEVGPKYWTETGRSDDPSVRMVHEPLAPGVGDGKSFLFLFGLKKNRPTDQKMLAREMEEIQDDIEVLRNAGYTVVVDPESTRPDFLQAVYGDGERVEGLVPAGIYWSAHGSEDGSIECCDGSKISPSQVEAERVSPGLKLLVFGACYTGAWARTWRESLGGQCLVVGWGRPVTIDRAVEFLQSGEETDTDLEHLIAHYMIADAAVPALSEETAGKEAAFKRGRKDEIATRIEKIAELLGARWRAQETWFEIQVPLPEGRRHVTRIFALNATAAYVEGKPLVGVEAEVGELTGVVEPGLLLNDLAEPSYARVVLVKGKADFPDILVQGFFPLLNATDLEIVAVVHQVAQTADRLEHSIFGGDRRD